MKTKFKIIISSDQEYEELCAEIYYENRFVAILTQEKGFKNLEVAIYPQTKETWIFKFSDFLEVFKVDPIVKTESSLF